MEKVKLKNRGISSPEKKYKLLQAVPFDQNQIILESVRNTADVLILPDDISDKVCEEIISIEINPDLQHIHEHEDICEQENFVGHVQVISTSGTQKGSRRRKRRTLEHAVGDSSCEEPPKRGRKRKYAMSRSERKINRNSNLPTFTETGKPVEPREFIDFHCKCKCHEIVSVEAREELFRNYWNLGSYDLQTAFILHMVTEQPIKRKRVPNSTKKEWTRVYSIGDFQVCRDIFVNTIRISPNRVNTALKKNRLSTLLSRQGIGDARGRKKGSKQPGEKRKNQVTAPADNAT